MAHFAELNSFLKVVRVVVVDDEDTKEKDGTETESVGAKYLSDAFGGTWVQTSYNTNGGIHKLDGTPFRKNYAGTGYTYDVGRDAFIPPSPFPSWTLDEATCSWEAPTPRPDGDYIWNEETQAWDEVII
jgi:hypothetical protein